MTNRGGQAKNFLPLCRDQLEVKSTADQWRERPRLAIGVGNIQAFVG